MRGLDAGLLLAAAVAASSAQAQGPLKFRNVSVGGELRHGVYGRIDTSNGALPPLIYPQPLVGNPAVAAANARPIVLYVPPGQVRKWGQHCHKWNACDVPVLFVRMDDSPSRLGAWSQLRVAQRD